MATSMGKEDFLACCGSTKFADKMVSAGPFANYQQAVDAARHIWFNEVDVHGCLEAFAAHPQIGESPSASHKSSTSAQWSKGEQSTALATATHSSKQELYEWNVRYKEKFGFIFLICAAGRSTPEILAELKKRFSNRPIVELEIAVQEQMKITELRLQRLFSSMTDAAPVISSRPSEEYFSKAEEGRMTILGGHLSKSSSIPTRTRPPITTHVLDTARGCPAAGVEIHLEMLRTDQPHPVFSNLGSDSWTSLGSSTTDKDGRSGQLMNIVDALTPGIYRISFNTGKYNPNGFFPYVSIMFEVGESQKLEHFHVPLLLSPFSFSTYRGS